MWGDGETILFIFLEIQIISLRRLRQAATVKGGCGCGTSTDNLYYIALCKTDDIQKRNVSRAGVEAATTLNAVLDSVGLQLVHHCVLCIFVKKERLKSHWAGICAFSATDAVGLGLSFCLLLREIEKRRRTFDCCSLKV